MARDTAIKRKGPSAPARWLVSNKLVPRGPWVLDMGCGRGADCRAFGWLGYDPLHRPLLPVGDYPYVVCTYVLNVLSEAEEDALIAQVRGILEPGGVAYFTVRRDKKTTIRQRVSQPRLESIYHRKGQFEIYELCQPQRLIV